VVYDDGASEEPPKLLYIIKKMVQTKDGAATNPWVVYMKACAAAYKAERAQQQGATGPSKAPLVRSTPKRRTRKPKVTVHLVYPDDRGEVLLNENAAGWELEE
jgi:hypothetical protein